MGKQERDKELLSASVPVVSNHKFSDHIGLSVGRRKEGRKGEREGGKERKNASPLRFLITY